MVGEIIRVALGQNRDVSLVSQANEIFDVMAIRDGGVARSPFEAALPASGPLVLVTMPLRTLKLVRER